MLLSLVALFSLTSPLTMAGIRALLPRLVPVAALDRANALDTAIHGVTDIGGPALAGVVMGFGGPTLALGIDRNHLRGGCVLPGHHSPAARTVAAPRSAVRRGVERRCARGAPADIARIGRRVFAVRGVVGHPRRYCSGVRRATIRRRNGIRRRRPALGGPWSRRRYRRVDRRPSAHRGPRAQGDGARHAGDRCRGMAARRRVRAGRPGAGIDGGRRRGRANRCQRADAAPTPHRSVGVGPRPLRVDEPEHGRRSDRFRPRRRPCHVVAAGDVCRGRGGGLGRWRRASDGADSRAHD